MNLKLGLAGTTLIAALAACATMSRPDLSGMTFSAAPLVGKVVWNDLITEDIDAARRFYGGLFGWTFEDAAGPGRRGYALARHGGIYVAGLVPVEARSDGTRLSRWLPYLSVADVDQAVAGGVASGGKVAVAARDVSLGRVAAMVDPEGAVIGFARSNIGDPDDNTTKAAPGRVVWTELLSDDSTAAAAFYAATVGYETRDIERRGGSYTLLGNDGVDRAGILKNPAQEWDPVWLTYFGVQDAAAAASKAVELGGKILVPVSAELRNGSMAVVADPAGAVLVLQKMSL
ncbi:MAG: VOC family protein [Woeseiaceae bacterium]|nr:VOC family protein [Woeseiaceae bacterium]